jgi:hypothetical protein
MENVGISYGHFEYLRPFGIIYGHLVMLWSFGIFSPVLVYRVKKNLANLFWLTCEKQISFENVFFLPKLNC